MPVPVATDGRAVGQLVKAICHSTDTPIHSAWASSLARSTAKRQRC